MAEKKQQFTAWEARLNQVERDFVAAKREMKILNAAANEIARIKDNNGQDLPLKAELEELPDQTEEIYAAIEDMESRINAISDNPQVLRDYESRKNEIANMREEIDGMAAARNGKKLELSSLFLPWYAALKNTKDRVNNLFSEYMTELNFAGR